MTGKKQLTRQGEYELLRSYLRCVGKGSDRLRIAVETELTPRQRQLVGMYYVDQLLMTDIASRLGVNVSTVSRTLARARTRLKRALRYSDRALLTGSDD